MLCISAPALPCISICGTVKMGCRHDLFLLVTVVLVNKSAPAGQLGAVNGAGQMLASAVRGAAPALCGLIWAASLGLRMPGHQFLPFAVVGSLFVGIFFWYFRQRAVIAQLVAK
jgi:hypothetical protein